MAKKEQTAAKKTKPKSSATKAKKSSIINKPKDHRICYGPLPSMETACEGIHNEVNYQLKEQCEAKSNTLAHCNECRPSKTACTTIDCLSDMILLNTGGNGSGGKISSGGGNDLCWEAGIGKASGPGSVSTWAPALVFRDTAWLASPFSDANWISVFPDADHGRSGNLDVYFRLRFSLNSSFDPNQFFLDMNFYVDNSIWEIYVNGAKQSTNCPLVLPQDPSNPYGHVGFRKGTNTRIILSDDWKSCDNEIIIHVKSGRPKVGLLIQNKTSCYEAKLPELAPEIKISWGDSNCDCLETNDLEVACISVRNIFSNVTFKDFKIGRIRIVDSTGKPVPPLPDGSPSVQIVPVGPHCFGDIGPCNSKPRANSCVSREFVIRTRGAKDGKYRLLLDGICYCVSHNYELKECFEVGLCKD